MTVKPNIKKNFNITWLLLYGAGLITVGILVLVNGKIVVEPAARLGGIFIVANGIHRLIRAYARHQRLPVFSGVGNIIIGLISVFFPAATLALLSFIFSLYVFLNALVKFIDFGTALKNAVPDAFYDFFSGIFFTVFGIIMLFGTLMGSQGMLVVIGLYCIIYGAGELRLFIREAAPNKAKGIIRRRIRFSLPQVITTFIPLKTLRSYTERLDSREIDIEKLQNEERYEKSADAPDIHVLIHVSADGVGSIGHCDLVLNGTVISYGNYDKSSERLFGGIGDGVLFKADFDDYCSSLWNGTHARFFKFKSGRFKTYFVMSTNCVFLADYILSKAGTDIVKTAGIITPGDYYDYMQSEYALPGGIVITRDIYSKYNVSPAET